MKTEMKFLVLLGAFAAMPALAQVYRWVDEKGTVHYSNAKPPAGVKAIADVSKNYRSFAGISENMDGQVKFIYRTDAIGD